jgi:hypothetical protein
MSKLLFSVVETPMHPGCSNIYQQYGFEEVRLNSIRSTIKEIKKRQPDILVAEFLYGYSNNYSGVHISNLDVLLVSLKKYSPNTKVVTLTKKSEQHFMARLPKVHPISKVLLYPLSPNNIIEMLKELS